MVHKHLYIPDGKEMKPDAGVASVHRVIYNATLRKNKKHGIIAAARAVCNATCLLCDESYLLHCQRVRDSVRAIRAARNPRVFLT